MIKNKNKERKIFHINVENETKNLITPINFDKPCMVFQLENSIKIEKMLDKSFQNRLILDNFKFYYSQSE